MQKIHSLTLSRWLKGAFALMLACGTLFFSACNTEDDLIADRETQLGASPPAPSAGNMDLSVYVSLGNSLTAGYMDYALYDRGQGYAYPNIMAEKFAMAGGGAFNQPDINSETGFNSNFSDLDNGVIAGYTVLDTDVPGPVPVGAGEMITPYAGDKSQLNNFGVPGTRIVDVLTPLFEANPYYRRFASNPGTSTILADAAGRNPSFVSVWLGSVDVLAWATSGGAGSDGNVQPGAEATPNALTGEAAFSQAYAAVMSTMFEGNDRKGVVINIPPITFVPFFRLVPFSPLPLDSATAALASGAAAGYNATLDALASQSLLPEEEAQARKLSFSAGANAVVIEDKNLTDIGPALDVLLQLGAITETQRTQLAPLEQARQANASDLILLSASRVIGTQAVPGNLLTTIGLAVPLGDQFVLTQREQNVLSDRRIAFNQIIEAEVAKYADRVTLLDINPLFFDLAGVSDGQPGIEYDGYTYLGDFSPNGIFSTDGIHPNPRGHAIVANEVIKLLNASFDANIPEVEVALYPSIELAP